MPAVSQQQQKLFGLALSVKRGETPRSEASPEVLKIVDGMSEKEIEKYAGTEHKGLPKTVEQKLRETIRSIVKEKMSVNEAPTRTAREIGGLTGMNSDFIQKFVDKHELDIEKVFQFVKKGKLKDRMDFVTALSGKPNNPIQKKMIKMFKESLNERVTLSTSQMKHVHDNYKNFKVTTLLNWQILPSLIKTFGKMDKKSLEGLIKMKPKAPLSLIIQKYLEGNFKNFESVNEKKVPKKGSPDYHQHKIAVDTVRNPMKAFMGGPSAKEAEQTLLKKFGYSKKEVEKLKESVNEADKPGEAVGYIEKNGRKKLIKTFKSLRAGKMWLTKERDKYLNQSGVERIGTMNKGDWDKFHAKYAESVNEIKKGSIVRPFAHDKEGDFIVDKVFKNKDGETSYTGKFKKSGKKKELILHSKDKIVKEAINPKVTVSRKEYDRLHKDFKGMVDGHPYMVYLDKKTGATVYGPVKIKETVVNEQEKTLPELMKIANQFKKELNDLQREYNKTKTQTLLNRVEAKKGQLLRVANAIRAAKAKQAESVNEGRGFVNAARKAKEEGKTEFEYNGKTYPVTLKEGMLNEMSDAEFVADQLSNPVADGSMGRKEFISFVSKETKYSPKQLGDVFDAYFKLGGRDRVKLDNTRVALQFLSKFGVK